MLHSGQYCCFFHNLWDTIYVKLGNSKFFCKKVCEKPSKYYYVPVARNAHWMRISFSTIVARLEFVNPINFLAPHWSDEFIGSLQSTKRIFFSAQRTDGAFFAMPTSAWNFVQSDTITVITSIAKVAEQHLVLVRMVIAFRTVFAVRAFPIVRSHVLQKFNVQADASWMRWWITFWTMQKDLRLTQFVAIPISSAIFTDSSRFVCVNLLGGFGLEGHEN